MTEPQTIITQLGRAEAMLAGLAAHAEALAEWGISTEFVTKLIATHTKALGAYNSKMAYKARMMEKRLEQQKYLDELNDQYAQARKLIKIGLPQETWREFGITDQR